MITPRLRRVGLGLTLSTALAAGLTAPAITAPVAHAADQSASSRTQGAQNLQSLLNAHGQRTSANAAPAAPRAADQGGVNASALDPRGCMTNIRVGQISPRQLENARTIIAVGKGHGIPAKGQVAAIATAIQESKLCNLNFGHSDSRGLFQQRPSTGWGSAGDVTNTVRAAQAFYGVAAHTRNPGLTDVRGWESMSVTRAAQSVQRSGTPNAFAQWEDEARWLVEQNAGVAPIR